MKLLDLTLATPAENLALDDALLEAAEHAGNAPEVLRLWESPQPAVVVGRSSQLAVEVDLDACRRSGVPVLRRCSGGAAVVVGPGCLMYALVLSLEQRPHLRFVTEAHRTVLGRLVETLRPLVPGVRCLGTSDLAVGDRKFSGNSLRCKRTHLLYHGTLLYDFPVELIARCLRSPPRQPDYRQGRSHEAFVANVPVPAAALRRTLVAGFAADEPLTDWPVQRTAQLVGERYARADWNSG
jgi:lipoate-protein ligase A